MSDEEWRSQIIQKILALVTNPTARNEILFYLQQQEQASNGYQNSAAWRMLKDLLISDEAFLGYLRRFLEEIERNRQSVSESNVAVKNRMLLRKTSNGKCVNYLEPSKIKLYGSIGFAHALSCIGPIARYKILSALNVHSAIYQTFRDIVHRFGKKVSIIIGVAYLSVEAGKNISRWQQEQISGKSVMKKTIGSYVAVTASIVGGMVGAAVGDSVGPFETVSIGVIGSIVAGVSTSFMFDLLTQDILDISNDEAVENVHDSREVDLTSSLEEIEEAIESASRAYRQLNSPLLYPSYSDNHQISPGFQTDHNSSTHVN